MADAATQLAAAEDAYHRLVTGQAVAAVDIGGRSVTYTKADLGALRIYISDLRAQVVGVPATRPIYLGF